MDGRNEFRPESHMIGDFEDIDKIQDDIAGRETTPEEAQNTAADEPPKGGVDSDQPSDGVEEEKDEKDMLVSQYIIANKRYKEALSDSTDDEQVKLAYEEFSKSVEDVNGYFIKQNGPLKFNNWNEFMEYFNKYSPYIFEISNQCYKENVKPEPLLQNMMVETALSNTDIPEERRRFLSKIAEYYKVDFSGNTDRINKIILESTDPVGFAADMDELRGKLIIQETILRGPVSVFQRSFQMMAMDPSKSVLVNKISEGIKEGTSQEMRDSIKENLQAFHEIGNATQNIGYVLTEAIRTIEAEHPNVTMTNEREFYSIAMDIVRDEFGVDIRAIVKSCEEE